MELRPDEFWEPNAITEVADSNRWFVLTNTVKDSGNKVTNWLHLLVTKIFYAYEGCLSK